jgi:hypothetical protein
MNDEKLLTEEALYDLVRHPLAAEEDGPLVLTKRAQTRIGPRRQHQIEDSLDLAVCSCAHRHFSTAALF